MKILHVIGEMGYGGAELLVVEMGLRMVRAGHTVDVLVIGFCEESVLQGLEDGGVRVLRLNASLLSPLGAWRIARTVSCGAYDVVHAHLFPALYLVAISRIFASSTARWFYTEHSTSNRRRNHSALRPIERVIYQRFEKVVCISADAASALEVWLPGLLPLVIVNGIDFERFQSAIPLKRASIGVSDSAKIVAMVGAFRREKNHVILVEALAMLPGEFVVVFAGDGPERVAVEQRAHSLGVHGRVKFLGVVREVERLLKTADVFVLPSFFEGFGLSAIEACASGVPVVHSMVPGLSAVLEGVGWPIDPCDAEGIARHIEAVAAGGEAIDSRRELARALARKYGIDSTVARHLTLYTCGEG